MEAVNTLDEVEAARAASLGRHRRVGGAQRSMSPGSTKRPFLCKNWRRSACRPCCLEFDERRELLIAVGMVVRTETGSQIANFAPVETQQVATTRVEGESGRLASNGPRGASALERSPGLDAKPGRPSAGSDGNWGNMTASKEVRASTEAGDVALVAAMAGGERAALGRLYDRYGPLLLAVGLRVFGERREAEDLLHDVFLEAWRQAARYDAARGTVRTWLIMRMRSRCLDRLRAAGYSRTVGVDALDRHDAAIGAGDGDISLSPDRAAVRRAVQALPSEQRVVLELGYFEGLSSAEISEREDIPIGTVKSRVAAALAKLRAGLAHAGGVK